MGSSGLSGLYRICRFPRLAMMLVLKGEAHGWSEWDIGSLTALRVARIWWIYTKGRVCLKMMGNHGKPGKAWETPKSKSVSSLKQIMCPEVGGEFPIDKPVYWRSSSSCGWTFSAKSVPVILDFLELAIEEWNNRIHSLVGGTCKIPYLNISPNKTPQTSKPFPSFCQLKILNSSSVFKKNAVATWFRGHQEKKLVMNFNQPNYANANDLQTRYHSESEFPAMF